MNEQPEKIMLLAVLDRSIKIQETKCFFIIIFIKENT